jgi:tryptophan-rich hypothetical protein
MNLKKLLNSKWTAVVPENGEKHFVVTKVERNSKDAQVVDFVCLEAVTSKRVYQIDPRELGNKAVWLQGWQ